MPKATPERVQRVRLILGVIADHHETWAGRQESGQAAQPAPTHWATCPTCQASGGARQQACSRCDGRGFLLVDPYTADYDLHHRVIRTGAGHESETRAMDAHTMDRVIERLREQARERGETDPYLVGPATSPPQGDVRGPLGMRSVRKILRTLHLMRDSTVPGLRACHRAIELAHWPQVVCHACSGTGRRMVNMGGFAMSPIACRHCQGTGRPVPTVVVRRLERVGVHWAATVTPGRLPLPSDLEGQLRAREAGRAPPGARP